MVVIVRGSREFWRKGRFEDKVISLRIRCLRGRWMLVFGI